MCYLYTSFRAVEEFITCFPQHINLRDDEGLTPLHVAAIANHCDIVTYLAEQVYHSACMYRFACTSCPLHWVKCLYTIIQMHHDSSTAFQTYNCSVVLPICVTLCVRNTVRSIQGPWQSTHHYIWQQ